MHHHPCCINLVSASSISVSRFVMQTSSKANQPIHRQQILDSSKLRELADHNFKVDENGRKFSKRVENIVGKGEIARNFSFSHSVFKLFVPQTPKNNSMYSHQ